MNAGFFEWWYDVNGRWLPWRQRGLSSYQLLLAELLLKRTTASAVARVWPTLVAKHSSPSKLLAASHDELVDALRPLGLAHQRDRALRVVSGTLIDEYQGEVPKQLENLMAIPFVGRYTASAVLCFSMEQRIPVVDTNILRLFSRFYGIRLGTDNRRSPDAWKIAQELLPNEPSRAKRHNYGILDFCAAVCKPRGPECQICPLCEDCSAPRIG